MNHASRHRNQSGISLAATCCLVILTTATRPSAIQMADYTGIVFPADHALNMPVDSLPVHANSDNFITGMGKTTGLHPDFGTSWDDDGTPRQMGIPYNVVGAGQPPVPIKFVLYDDESDPGPWPIPANPLIETVFDWRETDDGDRHMLIVDTSAHKLYECGNTFGVSGGTSWEGGCGAVFNLNGYELRPDTWTSSDAAGLPIFPLLIRYDEVARAMATGGELHHPIRFTASATQKAYIWPARHYASSSTDKNRPPMGLRVRLKASFNISGYSPRMQVILRTMKKYGLIMSDNGSNWYFQGTHDDRWDDEEINTLKAVRGGDFEVVDISSWMSRPGFDPNSGRVPPISGATQTSPAQQWGASNFIVRQSTSGAAAGSIEISTFLPTGGQTIITVSDGSGRSVATLYDGFLPAGPHTIRSAMPQRTGSGIYLIRMQRPDGMAIVRNIVMIQ